MTARPLSALRRRLAADGGFTLLELLVVGSILGILAAISLPQVLGHQEKGHDAGAKSRARSLMSHVQSCYVEALRFDACATSAALQTTGLKLAAPGSEPAVGEVGVSDSTAETFVITAKSDAGAYFAIVRDAAGALYRRCGTPFDADGGYPATFDEAGCAAGSW